MSSIARFVLDLQGSQSQISLPVMLGDTDRVWYITLTDAGKEYEIEEGSLAVIEIKRPNGTFLSTPCQIVDNRTIKYDFSYNDFTVNTAVVAGVHYCSIRIVKNDEVTNIGRIIAAAQFTMVVSERAISSDDINLSDSDITFINSAMAAEAGRVAAETIRINAEADRVEAELERAQTIKNIEDMVDNGEFDGVSPTVSTEEVEGGTKVIITDINGTHEFVIYNGEGATAATYTVELSIDDKQLTVSLKDANNETASTSTVDLPFATASEIETQINNSIITVLNTEV